MKNTYHIIALSIFTLLPLVSFSAGIIPSDAEIAANGFGAFAGMINMVINTFLQLSVVIATITFAYAGANMLLHPDNPGEREKAKDMFKKTVLGLIIVLVAWLVVNTIVSTLVNPGSGALRFLK